MSDTLLYIHPPRHNYLKVLELAPYPRFQNPQLAGHTYTPNLKVEEIWAIDSLFPIKSAALFHEVYRNNGVVTLNTSFGRLQCWEVIATSSSIFGISTATFYFHKKWGLLKAHYKMPNGSDFELTLIEKRAGTMRFNETFMHPEQEFSE